MFRHLLVLLLVLILSGCVRQHVDMTLHADAQFIDIDMIAAVDPDAAKVDVGKEIENRQVDASAFGPEARWEPVKDGKWVGQHLIAPNTPIKNVLEGGLLVISTQGSLLTFETSPHRLGWGAETTNFTDVAASEADLRLRLRLPGQIQDTNGQVEGEWVVWTTKDATLDVFRATVDVTKAVSLPEVTLPQSTEPPLDSVPSEDGVDSISSTPSPTITPDQSDDTSGHPTLPPVPTPAIQSTTAGSSQGWGISIAGAGVGLLIAIGGVAAGLWYFKFRRR